MNTKHITGFHFKALNGLWDIHGGFHKWGNVKDALFCTILFKFDTIRPISILLNSLSNASGANTKWHTDITHIFGEILFSVKHLK
jgi:hypothetical protein